MFDRIRKAFFREPKAPAELEEHVSLAAHGPVSEWAGTQGFAFSVDERGTGVALEGKVGGKPWRLQLGRPSRDYIHGEEVRARAELGVNDDTAVLVMSRPLKTALEKQAYQIYTDQLQTSAHSNLPEEMRWLAMYDEVGWDSLPRDFWDRYSVLTDRRESALAWVDPSLAQLMMRWPQPAPAADVPFMIMLLRGKVYLRMEYSPPDIAVLRHASDIFTSACESALGNFSGRPA